MTACGSTADRAGDEMHAAQDDVDAHRHLPTIPSPGVSTVFFRHRSATARGRGRARQWRGRWGAGWPGRARRQGSGSDPGSPSVRMSTSAGRPVVSVPVLSMTSALYGRHGLEHLAALDENALRAARLRPATSATGTARMSGQGVATTRTATMRTTSPERTRRCRQ